MVYHSTGHCANETQHWNLVFINMRLELDLYSLLSPFEEFREPLSRLFGNACEIVFVIDVVKLES